MTVEQMLAGIKARPEFQRAGMVLVHNGVVRNCTRDGRPVTGLRVRVDRGRLEEVLRQHRALPGIVDIQVWIDADRDLAVGEDVMLLAVAGDIRENVIAALACTLEAIKTSVTSKTEFLSPEPAG
jgi:molybdopterin synthase catalytic subunit